MARECVMQGVSFKPDLLQQAKNRAEKLDIGFSTYIQLLVKKDLKEEGPLLVEPFGEATKEKELTAAEK